MSISPRSPFAKNWLIYKLHDRALEKEVISHFRGTVLDIGCGSQPYKNWLETKGFQYTGIDLPDRAEALPFPDAQFDSVLCTAVIEHIPEPELAVREAFRVLRPGGRAIYSIPFIWHIHEEPQDYFRFSRYAIERIFSNAGFEIEKVLALSGFWATFGQLLTYQLYRLNRRPIRYIGIIPFLGFFIQRFFYLLDKLDKTDRWTWMYLAVVKKT